MKAGHLRHESKMSLTGYNGDREDVMEIIVQRLERLERRLQALERRETCKGTGSGEADENFKARFGENISIIGLKEAIGSKHSGLQFLWLTFFIVCLISTGFFVWRTLGEYLAEPTATKVKLIEDEKYEYPTMLLCPDTWLDAEKAVKDGLSVEGIQYALGYLINYYVNPPPYRIDNYTLAKSDFYSYYDQRGFSNLVDFFKSIALDSSTFFYRCPFCRNSTFNKVLMSESVCYEIRMHPSPGNAPVVSSLDMLEVIVPDRTLGLLTHRSYWRLFLGSDLRLGESTRRYAEIYPDRTNTIQFITHRFISVGKAGSPCIPPSQTLNYSYARCVVQCFVEKYGGLMFMMTACSDNNFSGCDDNRMLTPNQTFHFYPDDLWDRLSYIHQSEKGGEEAPAYCYERCPSLCERMIYTIDVQAHRITPVVDLRQSNSRYTNINKTTAVTSRPSTAATARKLRGKYRRNISTPANLTRIYLLNSAAVYGGVLTFEEVSTYSFETMVGNVGGMLSLWMGVSIMSLIQLFMFLTTEWCKCNRRRPSPMGTKLQNGIVMDTSAPTSDFLLQATRV